MADLLSPAHLLLLLLLIAGIVVWVCVSAARRRRQRDELMYLRGQLDAQKERQGPGSSPER